MFGKLVGLVIDMLENYSNIETDVKEAFREWHGTRALCSLRIRTEKFEVATPVKDIKLLFVFAISKDIRAKTSTATNHLPKFNLRADYLKEYQVQHLRHIDAGVEHIDRNGYLNVAFGCLFRLGKIIKQILRIGGIVIYDRAEVRSILRIEHMETLHNEFCVLVPMRKNDSFANGVAIVHF